MTDYVPHSQRNNARSAIMYKVLSWEPAGGVINALNDLIPRNILV